MTTPESKASDVVRIEACQRGSRIFRNNNGACKDPNSGRLIRYGLANESKKLNSVFKSGDFIGVTPVVITQDMVGSTIGVFTNIEVKAEGKVPAAITASKREGSREWAQLKFINLIKKLGGFAGFASNANHVAEILSDDRFKTKRG